MQCTSVPSSFQIVQNYHSAGPSNGLRPIIRDQHLFNINSNFNFKSRDRVVSFRELDEDSYEYEEIMDMITNEDIVVDSVEKINNQYLFKAYNLKKNMKYHEYPDLCEKLLFHGTKEANVMDICKYNFNWRYTKQHKFGKGVSFSTNCAYAANYSDQSDDKVMFLAQVLVGRSCVGHPDYILPPIGYDTTVKNNGIVTVKYEDHEFHPKYLLRYHFDEDDDDEDEDTSDDYYYDDYYDYNSGYHYDFYY